MGSTSLLLFSKFVLNFENTQLSNKQTEHCKISPKTISIFELIILADSGYWVEVYQINIHVLKKL